MADDNLLSDDERSYFMEMESLFNHPGWARLTKEIQAEVDQIPLGSFEHVKSWDQVLEARARWNVLRELVGYPEAVEKRREHLEHTKLNAIDEVSTL